MLVLPISWSGRGSLVPGFALLAIVVGLVIAFFARAPGAGLGTLGPWPFSAGFGLVGVVTLPLGFWLNRRSVRAPDGPAPHRFCGLAMQWWSVLMLAFGGLLLTDDSKAEPRGTGPVPAVMRKE